GAVPRRVSRTPREPRLDGGLRMTRSSLAGFLVSSAVVIVSLGAAAYFFAFPEPPARPVTVKLGEVPKLDLTPAPAVREAPAGRIRRLTAPLADPDEPDFGLSASLSGSAFAPLPGQHQAGALLLTDHGLQPSEALQTLVRLGPDALPFLLDALDD